MMKKSNKKCFVCKKEVNKNIYSINKEVNLPVCHNCEGTANERKAVANYLDSLADGFVCGCI